MSNFSHRVMISHHKYKEAMAWCYENVKDGGRAAQDHEFKWHSNILKFDEENPTHVFYFEDKETATWFELAHT